MLNMGAGFLPVPLMAYPVFAAVLRIILEGRTMFLRLSKKQISHQSRVRGRPEAIPRLPPWIIANAESRILGKNSSLQDRWFPVGPSLSYFCEGGAEAP
jgi:hypothetical protein